MQIVSICIATFIDIDLGHKLLVVALGLVELNAIELLLIRVQQGVVLTRVRLERTDRLNGGLLTDLQRNVQRLSIHRDYRLVVLASGVVTLLTLVRPAAIFCPSLLLLFGRGGKDRPAERRLTDVRADLFLAHADNVLHPGVVLEVGFITIWASLLLSRHICFFGW